MLHNTNLLQTCFVEMSIQEKEKTKVQLVPDELEMFQKTTMAIFFFTHVTLTYKNESSFDEGIHLVLRMKRIITSEMMTTYLPTALLLLITYSTTFFKPCFFEAALSVNLTTMLVMTTIFISKMESLPATSYMKMIDIWLILCQLAPFAQVVLITTMEYFRKDEYGNESEEGMETNMKIPANLHSGVQGTLQAVGGLKVSQGWRTSQRGKQQIVNISGMQIIGEFFFIKRFKY